MMNRTPLLTIASALLLFACEVEDPQGPEPIGNSTLADQAGGTPNNVNAQDSIGFSGLSANCGGAQVAFVANAGNLSALFENLSGGQQCVISGTVIVPEGVFVQQLSQYASGFSDGQGALRYNATLNNRPLANFSETTWGEFQAGRSSNLLSIGEPLCYSLGESRLPFRIQVDLAGFVERTIDSVDWSFTKVGYCP